MKRILISLILLACASAPHAAEWKVKPKLYVRGGFTQSLDLDAKGDNYKNYNNGGFGEETNAFSGNLTEVDLIANYKDLATIVYGVNYNDTTRFEEDDDKSSSFRERQAYIEMHKIFGTHGTIWFGRRPYRGFGDYLTASFPLDERNMFGGGIKVKVGPGQYEFAYGTNEDSAVDGNVTNFFLNKYILPITNGNVTVNTEFHQNNSSSNSYESNGQMIGAQYARWNMKLMDANWYNIFVVNYSRGHLGGVEAGMMNSAFDSKKKGAEASKALVKIGGDLKSKMWSALYALQYQWHDDDSIAGNQNWQFVDLHSRPMYALTTNIGLGLDYTQRIVIKEATIVDHWSNNQNMWRAGLMLSYHLSPGGEQLFENAEISVITGRVHKQTAQTFFQGRTAKKDANFIRFKYTMGI